MNSALPLLLWFKRVPFRLEKEFLIKWINFAIKVLKVKRERHTQLDFTANLFKLQMKKDQFQTGFMTEEYVSVQV